MHRRRGGAGSPFLVSDEALIHSMSSCMERGERREE